MGFFTVLGQPWSRDVVARRLFTRGSDAGKEVKRNGVPAGDEVSTLSVSKVVLAVVGPVPHLV